MNKVIYFDNPASPIGNSVVSFKQERLDDVTGIAARAIAKQGLPESTAWELLEDIIEVDGHQVFKNARKAVDGKLVVDLEKSRAISHTIRRQIRSTEFMPVDGDNPMTLVNAEGETARAAILLKHDVIQVSMDGAGTVEQLKSVMKTEGWVE